jgi:hypothetical protein
VDAKLRTGTVCNEGDIVGFFVITGVGKLDGLIKDGK